MGYKFLIGILLIAGLLFLSGCLEQPPVDNSQLTPPALPDDGTGDSSQPDGSSSGISSPPALPE
ncbi:MAG: hypothetical protein J4478_05210 [Candidatus Diapherotrites archaeon]|uniref:Uncharacterized protein n=1 Tax=Candidatus Iainarchaeum sp. TaxID=3101447 RepID=A0A8T4L000_9ARCH|nr:hypothetical protein [Candidatus Diapherotrites archaeon]